NRIKELKKQHEEIKKKIEQDENEKEDLSKQKWSLESSIETLGKKLTACEEILEPHKEFDRAANFAELKTKFKKELSDLAFENIDDKESKISEAIIEEIESKNKIKTGFGNQLLGLMIKFKRP